MNPRLSRRQPARRQRGVGAVVVVMVLFFVVSLMAAYTSRNLIFEQKISANQARATLAFEAADAGVEWTLTMLNAGRISDSCGPGTTTDSSFQQRYLTVDANGNFTNRVRAGGSLLPGVWPACVFNGGGWTCSCPDAAALTPAAPAGGGPFPAFRVWPGTQEPVATTSDPFAAIAFLRPGLISVGTAACSRLPTDGSGCLNFMPRGEFGDGIGNTRVFLALRSGLGVPPAAAITARGAVTPFPGSAKLKVVNENEPSGGYTVNTGATLTIATKADFDPTTVGGTPGSASFADADARLFSLETVSTSPPALTAGERMFVSMFGMKRQTYRDQPGLRVCPSPCDAAALNVLLNANPNRVVWVEGDLTADANIGSTASPALLVIDGDTLTMSSGVTITGFVYMAGATSTIELPAGATTILGALAAEGGLDTHYAATPAVGQELTVQYDSTILDLLRNTYGSWVRMPSGWRDFKETP